MSDTSHAGRFWSNLRASLLRVSPGLTLAAAAFFPIHLNVLAGARRINPLPLQSGAVTEGGGVRGTTCAILPPGAMPRIMAGLRPDISWTYLIPGELTGAPNGFRPMIMDARMPGRIDTVLTDGRICYRL